MLMFKSLLHFYLLGVESESGWYFTFFNYKIKGKQQSHTLSLDPNIQATESQTSLAAKPS